MKWYGKNILLKVSNIIGQEVGIGWSTNNGVGQFSEKMMDGCRPLQEYS